MNRPRLDEGPLARARSAALDELRRHPTAPSWRTTAAVLLGALAGTTALFALAAWTAGMWVPGELARRAPAIALLSSTQALGVWAAVMPRPRLVVPAVLATAGLAVIALAIGRLPVTHDSTVPAWVCTASHVGVGLVPLVVAVLLLRRAAYRPLRALCAGLAVGSVGASLGELICVRGWKHALVYHVAAWAIVTVLCLLLGRAIRPRTFAP
jgi:hypothetical protein